MLIDQDGQNRGVTDILEANKLAEEAGLDLVEIVPNANPPVCKILDYGKFRFLEQKKAAESIIADLTKAKVYSYPIVTEVSPFSVFYKAEDYHQDYYNQHGSQSYCQIVIRPKVEKFEKVFKDRLKK